MQSYEQEDHFGETIFLFHLLPALIIFINSLTRLNVNWSGYLRMCSLIFHPFSSLFKPNFSFFGYLTKYVLPRQLLIKELVYYISVPAVNAVFTYDNFCTLLLLFSAVLLVV